MALDSKIEMAVDDLIDLIKGTDSYHKLEEWIKVTNRDSELRSNIQRTRQIRQELGQMSENDREGDYAERLEEEYDRLCDITAVHEFSLAELEFCGLYQEVITRIVDSLEI